MDIVDLFSQFKHQGIYESHKEMSHGHINTTIKIITNKQNYILQRLNTSVFKEYENLIKNKVLISKHLSERSLYQVASYVESKNETFYVTNDTSEIWTLSEFIKDSVTYLKPQNKAIVYEAGCIIGDFVKCTSTFEVDALYEVLPDFHNLNSRIKQFNTAYAKADAVMITQSQGLVDIVKASKNEILELHLQKTAGKFPIRVAHNDAKLSNILFHKDSNKAIAIIDFDTIMSGILHYDFGDAIRSMCSSALEDEKDLSKVSFNIDYYKAFTEGFAATVGQSITEIEIQYLPLSIKYMLYEQGLRFLTDYLNNNIYYAVDYPEHNLVRAKNQFKLLTDVDTHFESISSITKMVFGN